MSATTTPPPKAVIFDAYGTLFDVHSVVAAAEQMFPGHGDALSQLWRQKQIEYTQLRTASDPAGALIDAATFVKMKAQKLDPHAYLDNNDATAFFAATGDLLQTGPTLTNVNDIRVVLVD